MRLFCILLYIFFPIIVVAQTNQGHSRAEYSFMYSFGVGSNLTTMCINDNTISGREDVAIIKSLSFINDFNFLSFGHDYINLRLSMNYSWLTNSELSFGNYTYIDKVTKEKKEMPLNGNFENEVTSLKFGAHMVGELYESFFVRFLIINAEMNYNKRFNLEIINNNKNFKVYNPETDETFSSNLFNYDNSINFILSYGLSIFYRYEPESALLSKMDIELGILFKDFHYEEISGITQYQLRLIFF